MVSNHKSFWGHKPYKEGDKTQYMFLENLVLCICKGNTVPIPLMKIFVYENPCYTNAHVLCFLLIVLQWFNKRNDPYNGPKDYKFAHVAYSCVYYNYVYKF